MTITDLYATYAYPANHTGLSNLPILVVMHGYGSGAFAASPILERMASYGVFAVAPGMRGRDVAGGTPDSGGRELYDIYDVLAHVRSTFASRVSTTRAGIVGYSGGGGNALGCAAKFPDAFEVVVSHFGMSDYGEWTSTSDAWVGGDVTEIPDAYATRAYRASVAQNFTGGHLWLYHDEDDVVVPVNNSTDVADAMATAGRTNYEISITDSGDAVRWIHGNPFIGNSGEPNIATEANWLSALAAGTHTAWTVPTSGTVDVRGYIVTKRFEIWLGGTSRAAPGAGLDEVASVTYDTTTHSYTIAPSTGPTDVHITEGSLSASATGITTPTVLTAT